MKFVRELKTRWPFKMWRLNDGGKEPKKIKTRLPMVRLKGIFDIDLRQVWAAGGVEPRETAAHQTVFKLQQRGLTEEQIAEELGVSESTIKSRGREIKFLCPRALSEGELEPPNATKTLTEGRKVLNRFAVQRPFFITRRYADAEESAVGRANSLCKPKWGKVEERPNWRRSLPKPDSRTVPLTLERWYGLGTIKRDELPQATYSPPVLPNRFFQPGPRAFYSLTYDDRDARQADFTALKDGSLTIKPFKPKKKTLPKAEDSWYVVNGLLTKTEWELDFSAWWTRWNGVTWHVEP